MIVKQQRNSGGSTIKREYQWFDHQGSVMLVSDLAGVPVAANAKMSYDGFGLRREASGTAFSLARLIGFNSDASTRHGYTGHEMLDEAGLIHMNARLYDPQISRFIQADPLVQEPTESQSLNRYSYVMNNPLNATDPTGMFSEGGFGFLGSMFFGTTPCPGCHGTPGHTQQDTKVMASAPGTLGGAFSNALMNVSPDTSARIGGAGQMILGFTGMAGTAATAATTACAGVVGCGALAAVGAVSVDQAAMGFDSLIYGTSRDSAISQGAQYLGASPSAANYIDMGLSGAAGVRVMAAEMAAGAGAALKNKSALTTSLDDFSGATISSPGSGLRAIASGAENLSPWQASVLARLEGFGSSTVIPKTGFGHYDLAALSAATGDEFAMFTTGGRRLIMRGGPDTVPVTQSMADSLSSQGWRWSAHTHPDGILRSSSGDRAILGPFRNTTSAILDPFGGKARFNTNGDMLDAGWLPR